MGGAVLGYGVVAAYAFLRFDMMYLWFAWLVLLNGPHLFAMYTRTYLSPEERKRRPALFGGSLWLFAVGPAVLALCALLTAADVDVRWARAPFIAYMVLVGLWAYWHVVRQHHGIVRLYHRKNGENDDAARADRTIDFLLIHVGLTAPLLAFLVGHPELRVVIGVPALAHVQDAARVASIAAVAATSALWVARQAQRALTGRALNVPKLIFLAAIVPFYLFILSSETVRSAPLFAIVPLAIMPHDLQYQAMVWLHNRSQRAEAAAVRVPAARLLASLPMLAACAIATGALLASASCALDRALDCPEAFYATTSPLPGAIAARDVLIVVFHGFFIHHYFIDQHIWRPGRDARLAARLGLSAARAAT
jgi:hypothetical protein